MTQLKEALSRRSKLVGAALGALVITSGSVCQAERRSDGGEALLEEARSAFREGLSLEAAGNWAPALQKFEQVARVRLTPQVRFHIARCKSHLGRLNEALGEYRIAEYEAEQQSLTELPEIRSAREELEGRVPRLVIVRAEGAVQSRILLDGIQLGETSLTQPVTLDPGPHRLEAVSPSGQRFEQDFNAVEGQTQEVAVRFAAAEPPQTASSRPTNEDKSSDLRPEASAGATPWILSGVGAASLGASVYFLLQAGEAQSQLDTLNKRIGDRCVGGECSEEVRPEVRALETQTQDRNTFSALGYGGLAVSGVALGAAAYLWLSADSEEQATGSGVMIGILPGDARISFQGAF